MALSNPPEPPASVTGVGSQGPSLDRRTGASTAGLSRESADRETDLPYNLALPAADETCDRSLIASTLAAGATLELHADSFRNAVHAAVLKMRWQLGDTRDRPGEADDLLERQDDLSGKTD